LSYTDNVYGKFNYKSDPEINTAVEQLSPDLIKYLPQFLCKNKTMKTLQSDIFSKEIGILKFQIQDLIDQCFVETATWGLEYWEKFLGIPVNREKPEQHRREVIKAKIQGSGTVTKQMIVNVAANYSGGEVEVIELPKEHKFIIKFVGARGIPLNVDDLTETINEIKPAHLTFEYKYTYSLWGWCKNYTWDELKVMTWERAMTDIDPDYKRTSPAWNHCTELSWNTLKPIRWNTAKEGIPIYKDN
jgi:uncharacterized protein YmfQ (DUF2313 family)